MSELDNTDQNLPAIAAESLARGDTIVLYDDAHPELGGHLCCSATRVDADKINFMITHARGLICLAMSESRMHALSIPMMVGDTPFSRRLAFGASIEASSGVTTGISAADRARTIEVASAAGAGPDDIVMPGHVFPVMVRGGGVLVKGGLPEAAVDLVSMAGDGDSAALCTILDDDGEVADRDAVARAAKSFGFVMLCVSDVVARAATPRAGRRASGRAGDRESDRRDVPGHRLPKRHRRAGAHGAGRRRHLRRRAGECSRAFAMPDR